MPEGYLKRKMLKNKSITSLVLGLLMLFVIIVPAKAASVLTIQTLPSYINIREFKLSCTTDASSVSFSVSKNDGSPTTFATVGSPCLVQVTGSQITEEAKYTFTVTDGSLSSSTTTIFDNSGPSAVSGYFKDGLNDGFRLHYHTPSDSDFDKVIIYRGDEASFSADSSHEIATINSSPNSDMTYEDHFGMVAGKTYYYYIRALDHAGNSSPLTGDGGVTTVITPTPGTVLSGTNVIILPRQEGTGSVLGTEATTSPTPESTGEPTLVERVTNLGNDSPTPIKWILTHKKISIGVLLVLAAFAYIVLRMLKKEK